MEKKVPKIHNFFGLGYPSARSLLSTDRFEATSC